MRHELTTTRIWITGASSGIGRACAQRFLQSGARVAISARNAEALEAIKREAIPGHCLVVPLNVTDRRANRDALNAIRRAWGGLDIAMLNAGSCEYVDASEFDAAVFERMMRLNFMGMVYGIEAALPLLRESKMGHIAGMSSIAHYAAMPRAAAYGAAKAAVSYMLDGLRIDLRREGIAVTTINPGFIRTPLTDRNEFSMPFLMDLDPAARRIVRGIVARRPIIEFPKRLAWSWKLLSILPAGCSSRLLGGKAVRA